MQQKVVVSVHAATVYVTMTSTEIVFCLLVVIKCCMRNGWENFCNTSFLFACCYYADVINLSTAPFSYCICFSTEPFTLEKLVTVCAHVRKILLQVV